MSQQWGRRGPSPWGRPPRRRRSPLGSVFLTLCVLALVAIAAATTAHTSSSGSDVAYQNTDYQVPPPDTNPPPLPYARTESQLDQYLVANPFYDQTAPIPVQCPGLSTIDAGTASDSRLESHFTHLTACLMRVWEPPVHDAGFELPRPTVTIYGRKVSTKCGTSDVNAFYCAADQQVYYSDLLPQAVPAVSGTPYGVDIVMAHEFGHTLQARTGILISAHLATRNDGDSAQLQSSRRLEVQADCFSGMFIRSISQGLNIPSSALPGIEDTYQAIGDDTLSGRPGVEGDHGTSATRLYWGKKGLAQSAISSCDTFVAPAALVR